MKFCRPHRPLIDRYLSTEQQIFECLANGEGQYLKVKDTSLERMGDCKKAIANGIPLKREEGLLLIMDTPKGGLGTSPANTLRRGAMYYIETDFMCILNRSRCVCGQRYSSQDSTGGLPSISSGPC